MVQLGLFTATVCEMSQLYSQEIICLCTITQQLCPRIVSLSLNGKLSRPTGAHFTIAYRIASCLIFKKFYKS